MFIEGIDVTIDSAKIANSANASLFVVFISFIFLYFIKTSDIY